MLISEIFFSIQGEGRLTGIPSVFIRTHGCNLYCKWCDTPYAKDTNGGGEIMSPKQILDTIKDFPTQHVVITGGEPMLQDDIINLTELLSEEDYHITIETNGTVYKSVYCNLMSISPKMSMSAPSLNREREFHNTKRMNYDALEKFVGEYNYQIKFVVKNASDIPEIMEFKQHLLINKSQMMFMPEGRTQEELKQTAPKVVELCKTYGIRYCPRVHIDIFGNKRGV